MSSPITFVICPACEMRVMPKADGSCPSCQAQTRGVLAACSTASEGISYPEKLPSQQDAPQTAPQDEPRGSVVGGILGCLVTLFVAVIFLIYFIIMQLHEPPINHDHDQRVMPGGK